MKNFFTKSDSSRPVGETAVYLFDDWFDPIEAGVRDRVRGFIQAMIEEPGMCGRSLYGNREIPRRPARRTVLHWSASGRRGAVADDARIVRSLTPP